MVFKLQVLENQRNCKMHFWTALCIDAKTYESMQEPYVSMHNPEISKETDFLGQPTSCTFFIDFQDESIQMMNIKVEEDHLSFQMALVPTQNVT